MISLLELLKPSFQSSNSKVFLFDKAECRLFYDAFGHVQFVQNSEDK